MFYFPFYLDSSNAVEARQDWRDVRTMAGVTTPAAIMKMRVCGARGQTQPESVSPTVRKDITKRKERNSVVYAPPAVSLARIHRKTALVAIPRSIVKVRLMVTLFYFFLCVCLCVCGVFNCSLI